MNRPPPTAGRHRPLALALALILALGATAPMGCIETEQTLTLHEDGSGTLAVNYAIGDQSARRLQGFDAAARRIAADRGLPLHEDPLIALLLNPDPDQLRARLESYIDAGIYLRRYTYQLQNARREFAFEIAFDSLTEVAATDFFPRYGFSLLRDTNANYRFSTGPWVTNSLTSAAELTSPEAATLLQPLLAGFRFTLTLRPPGRILESSAQRITPVSATWTFDIGEDPQALFRLQESELWATFSTKSTTLPSIRQTSPPP